MNGICNFLSAVANLNAPEAGHPVQDAVAVGIRQPDTFGLGDDACAFFVQTFVSVNGWMWCAASMA